MYRYVFTMLYLIEGSNGVARFYEISLPTKPKVGMTILLPINDIQVSVKEIINGIADLETVIQKVKDESELDDIHGELFVNGWDAMEIR